jgi:uncharacterized protein (DUF1800 family)
MGLQDPRTRIAHLLRRAGFGGSPAEIEEYTRLGFEGAVERLLDYENIADDSHDIASQIGFDNALPEELKAYWLVRLANTKRPLQEKMVVFWHGHFATAIRKVNSTGLMWAQNELFRRNALGSFRTMLAEISRDPAMLRWLDSNSNRKISPNENYARELMELFTMGRGNYTEDDVKAAARAFTGWHFNPALEQFAFNRNQHDFGPKTFLGRNGPWDGDDILRFLLEEPATARWIATRLFRVFAHDNPEPAFVDRFAAILRANDWQIKPLVRAILRSAEFSSERAYHAKVKSPLELVIGTLKTLGAQPNYRELVPSLRRMGQDLFNPPNVKGWDGGLAWVSTSTMLERFNFANRLLTNRADPARSMLNPAPLVAGRNISTAEQLVDHLAYLLVDGDLSPEVRQALLTYVRSGPRGSQAFNLDGVMIEEKVRGLIHLIASTPAYQSS